MKPFAVIQRLLRTTIGLDSATVGDTRIELAVKRRMESRGIENIGVYASLLANDSNELQELVEAVVVPETFFFREYAGLVAVADLFRSGALRATAQDPLRVLSLPCASGEEPYSIAMTLLAAGCPADALRIDGVDVSREAVRRAREATYDHSSFRGNAHEYGACFIETGGAVSVRPEVRACVQVEVGNLFAEGFRPPNAPYDVVFCRNLLIYLDAPARDRALGVLTRSMRPGGILLVSAACAFGVRKAGLTPVGTEAACAFRLESASGTERSVSDPRTAVGERPERPARSSVPLGALPRQPVNRGPIGGITKPRRDGIAVPLGSIGDVATLANSGQLQEAARLGESVARTEGATPELFVLLGTVDEALGNAERAERWFRRALYLDPAHPDALLHLSLLFDREGDPAAAERLRARAQRVGTGRSP